MYNEEGEIINNHEQQHKQEIGQDDAFQEAVGQGDDGMIEVGFEEGDADANLFNPEKVKNLKDMF